MNIAGVLLLRFIGSLEHSAAAQAAFAVGYTELFSLITWTSVGLLGAAATIAGQNLGAGNPERASHGVAVAARIGLAVAAVVGLLFLTVPGTLLGIFGMNEPLVLVDRQAALRFLSVSGLFITVALTYTGGLQGTGDTRGPLYISLISQIACRSASAPFPGDGSSPAGQHLAGDRAGTPDAGHPQRGQISPGEVAAHRRGHPVRLNARLSTLLRAKPDLRPS